MAKRAKPLKDDDVKPGMIVRLRGEPGRFGVLAVYGSEKILLPLDSQHNISGEARCRRSQTKW